MPAFHLITFGCQMNVRDSQWLAAKLRESGHEESPPEKADIIIVNTCSVREKPEKKIDAVLHNTQKLQGAVIAVLGCVAQQLGKKLFALDSRIRLVAGGDSIAMVPEAVNRVLQSANAKVAFLDFSPEYRERELDSHEGATAFVNIMQGCDNFCSYCIVPFTRGRQRSRASEAIIQECSHRLRHGAVEITLLGQNVNAWGRDSGEQGEFADLLEKIAALPGLRRLRYTSPHPADMTYAAIRAFALLPSLCPRLHLPLQSGSDRILARMRRGYTAGSYLRIVDELRKARPDMALSTDLIVGFPGETEADFAQTLALMRQCGFMASYSFCYSDRPGTKASLMPDKVAEAEKLDRLMRLQALQEDLGRDWLNARVGQRARVLVEGPSARGDSWQGRDDYGAVVNVELGPDSLGRLVDVRITESKRHCLMAQKADQEA